MTGPRAVGAMFDDQVVEQRNRQAESQSMQQGARQQRRPLRGRLRHGETAVGGRVASSAATSTALARRPSAGSSAAPPTATSEMKDRK